MIHVLNPVLRGWGEYFRTGNASFKFQDLDRFTRGRLVRLLARKGGRTPRWFPYRAWPHERFVAEHGLHRLLGTIRYPETANAG